MKQNNNGDIRFSFYFKFIQSLESPSCRVLVGSHKGDNFANWEKLFKKCDDKTNRYKFVKVRDYVL